MNRDFFVFLTRFGSWRCWGNIDTSSSLSCFFGSSWVVFVVSQPAVSYWRTHCNRDVQVPCLVFDGVWGRWFVPCGIQTNARIQTSATSWSISFNFYCQCYQCYSSPEYLSYCMTEGMTVGSNRNLPKNFPAPHFEMFLMKRQPEPHLSVPEDLKSLIRLVHHLSSIDLHPTFRYSIFLLTKAPLWFIRIIKDLDIIWI